MNTKAFSIELVLVIGLPVLVILGGAFVAGLAYTQGFTPVAESASATHRS